jgi:hypothetical protein
MGSQVSPDDAAMLELLLHRSDVTAVFQQVAAFYTSAAAFNEQIGRQDVATECAIARDGALASVTLLSERAQANDAECEALLAKLRASLAAPRSVGNQN